MYDGRSETEGTESSNDPGKWESGGGGGGGEEGLLQNFPRILGRVGDASVFLNDPGNWESGGGGGGGGGGGEERLLQNYPRILGRVGDASIFSPLPYFCAVDLNFCMSSPPFFIWDVVQFLFCIDSTKHRRGGFGVFLIPDSCSRG